MLIKLKAWRQLKINSDELFYEKEEEINKYFFNLKLLFIVMEILLIKFLLVSFNKFLKVYIGLQKD